MENERLSVQYQLLLQTNTQLEKNNQQLRESLSRRDADFLGVSGKCDQLRREAADRDRRVQGLETENRVLAAELQQRRADAEQMRAREQDFRREEEDKLRELVGRLGNLEQIVGESEKAIEQCQSEKDQAEQSLRSAQQELASAKSAQERELAILREELEKKQLELLYCEKLAEDNLANKDR